MSEPTYGAPADGTVDDMVDDAPQNAVEVQSYEQDEPVDDTDQTDQIQDVVDVPAAPQTGDAGVDEAVALLREAVAGPLDGQVAAYDATHRALQDRLADVEG